MLKVKSQIVSDSQEASLNLTRTGKSFLEIWQYAFSSDMIEKARLRDELRGLITRATKHGRFACAISSTMPKAPWMGA